MYIKIKLGDILKEKKISNRGFGKMVGIRYPTINEMCNNTSSHIPLNNLAKMCLVLNCRITDILELVPEKDDGFNFTFPDENFAIKDELDALEKTERIKPQKTRKAIKKLTLP